MSPKRIIAYWSLLAVAVSLSFEARSQESRSGHSAVTPAPREGRWMDRHQSFNEKVQANQGNIDLVFIGDSITHGWEGHGKSVWDVYYGHRKALNLGIGGDRTQHVLWRLDHGNMDGIQPKVAVVMIGTNNSGDSRNSASEMVDGVHAVVEKIQEKTPSAKILLLAIFPRGQTFNAQRGKILQVNQTLSRLADGVDVHYLDIGRHFLDDDGTIPQAIMPDFLHFTTAGYGVWAAAMESKLAALLGDEPVVVTHADVTGDWTFEIDGPEGMVESEMVLKASGARIAGRVQFGPDRELTIQDGGIFRDSLQFVIRRDRPQGGEMVYQLTGTVGDNDIRGEVSTKMDGETVTLDWSASRN